MRIHREDHLNVLYVRRTAIEEATGIAETKWFTWTPAISNGIYYACSWNEQKQSAILVTSSASVVAAVEALNNLEGNWGRNRTSNVFFSRILEFPDWYYDGLADPTYEEMQ